MKLKILIADDHDQVRQKLCLYLQKKFPSFVIEQAKNGAEALAHLSDNSFEIAFLDIKMPLLTGIEVVAKLRENKSTDCKIVYLSIYKNPEYFIQAREYGFDGYILKEYALDEIVHCIDGLKNGCCYFSLEMLQELRKFESQSIIDVFTSEEKEIMSLLAASKSTEEIADKLFMSKKKIQLVKKKISKKLEYKSDNELISWASLNRNYLG